MNTKILEKVGLTTNEIKVYTALLDIGSCTGGDIIKKTHLHRAGVYDTLERLTDKGLVSFVIKANRKYFEAASPKNILSYIEKQEEELADDKKAILNIIPELEQKHKRKEAKQDVTLYKGNKGLKSIFQDWLEAKSELLVLGAYTEDAISLQYHMKYTLPAFHKQRVKQKQMMKFIFPEQSVLRAKQLAKYKYTAVKLLKSPFASSTSIQVYGEKVAIILWSSEPIGIIIRSKEITQSYKDYFNVLWAISKEIT